LLNSGQVPETAVDAAVSPPVALHVTVKYVVITFMVSTLHSAEEDCLIISLMLVVVVICVPKDPRNSSPHTFLSGSKTLMKIASGASAYLRSFTSLK
jgi:hypothetical protein